MALFGVMLLFPTEASAANGLKRVQWFHEPPVARHFVTESGLLKSNAPFLGARTKKAGGGYTLNPVCKVPNGDKFRIRMGVLKKKPSGVYYIDCPEDGKAAINGGDYTTETKQMIGQRGRLSTHTVMIEPDDTSPYERKEALCFGIVAGNAVPGSIEVKNLRGVPDGCRVSLFGRTITANDYSVFKHRDGGTVPVKGWWKIPANQRKANTFWVPIHAPRLFAGNFVCRGRAVADSHPGKLAVDSSGKYYCSIPVRGFSWKATDFEVYVNGTDDVGLTKLGKKLKNGKYPEPVNFADKNGRFLHLCVGVQSSSVEELGIDTERPIRRIGGMSTYGKYCEMGRGGRDYSFLGLAIFRR